MAKKKIASVPGVPAVPQPTAVYLVLKNVRHDGESYVAGDEIELTAPQAAHLIAVGGITTTAVVNAAIGVAVATAPDTDPVA
jgi:hypothetical protein